MIQDHIEGVALEGSAKLTKWLPQIGGESWWRFYVFDQLTVTQQRALDPTAGRLEDLDPAALFRVLARNWAELCNHKALTGLQRTGFKYVKEVQDIRNDLSHKPIGYKIEADDLGRYLDTLKRLLKEIDGNERLINKIHEDWILVISTSSKPASIEESTSNKDESDNRTKTSQNDLVDTGARKKTPNTAVDGSEALIAPKASSAVQKALANATYIGIDFGTSTTVATAVTIDKDTGKMVLMPLPIKQPTRYGDVIENHLVNSVLTLQRGKVLFGSDAYKLKSTSIEGETTFSSFKMQLGINKGIGYPRSKMQSIRSAQEAAAVFFTYLREGIVEAVNRLGLSENIFYAISVPASFEANQRRDLIRCLEDAGYVVNLAGLIDEPNAAFLSYLHESAAAENSFIESVRSGVKNVLVYDFGAGTCDISILSAHVTGVNVVSQNKAISRFMALGGDDIDRTIAIRYLVPQLKIIDKNGPVTYDELKNEELASAVLPWLKPAAEALKIYCSDHLRELEIEDLVTAYKLDYQATATELPVLKIGEISITIPQPSLRLGEFLNTIELFSKQPQIKYEDDFDVSEQLELGEPKYLYAPVENALLKAEVDENNIDAILFIGGSAKISLVRSAVTSHFTEATNIIVPRDLQTHVSQGAALHCIGHHGLAIDFVKPITSEPIFVITKGGGLKLVVPAGSSVPSDKPFFENLRVSRAGQLEIELPMCVSNENKLLGILRIESKDDKGFSEGEVIVVTCSITHDKLLEATAKVGGVERKVILLNPLSNTELSPKELLMLEAKQHYNESLMSNNGRPSARATLTYAYALSGAGLYLEAAEQFIQADELDKAANHATMICYCYAMGNKKNASNAWAEIAYTRKKDGVTTFNYALTKHGDRSLYEKLLKQALAIDPNLSCALKALGESLLSQGKQEGLMHLEKASILLKNKLISNEATSSDCDLLAIIGKKLGRDDLGDAAQARKRLLRTEPKAYSGSQAFDEANLASADSNTMTVSG